MGIVVGYCTFACCSTCISTRRSRKDIRERVLNTQHGPFVSQMCMPYFDHDVIGSIVLHEIIRIPIAIGEIVDVANTRTRGAEEATQTPAHQNFQGRGVAGIYQSIISIVIHFNTGKFVDAAIAFIDSCILILRPGQGIGKNIGYFVMREVAHTYAHQGNFWRVGETVAHIVDSPSFVVGVTRSVMSGCGQFYRQRKVLGLVKTRLVVPVRVVIIWRSILVIWLKRRTLRSNVLRTRFRRKRRR
mmetsp:Transcript_24093/g.49926  ORF Transcript_24093/g.49926 Transcript_24093/m.49926 type:complete len:244 (+) Transcript_24093:411-1142(+)